jgi:hypothetical protein
VQLISAPPVGNWSESPTFSEVGPSCSGVLLSNLGVRLAINVTGKEGVSLAVGIADGSSVRLFAAGTIALTLSIKDSKRR